MAVAALNPHGAEGGLFGVEEASEIAPAIESCRVVDGINVRGPFSADTVFLRASRGEFDAVIACYHDQAMIPVKCLSFGEAVNVLWDCRSSALRSIMARRSTSPVKDWRNIRAWWPQSNWRRNCLLQAGESSRAVEASLTADSKRASRRM